MIDSLVTWLADLLQNDPRGAAALLIVLSIFALMNTAFIVFISADIDGIKQALRKRGIWV